MEKSITLIPDCPDILRSVKTTSNFSASIALKASSGLEAKNTSNLSSSANSRPSRVCCSSSTMSKLGFILFRVLDGVRLLPAICAVVISEEIEGKRLFRHHAYCQSRHRLHDPERFDEQSSYRFRDPPFWW